MLSTIRLSDKVVHEYTRAGSKEEEKDGTKFLLDIQKNERREVYIDFIDKYNYELLVMVLDNVTMDK